MTNKKPGLLKRIYDFIRGESFTPRGAFDDPPITPNFPYVLPKPKRNITKCQLEGCGNKINAVTRYNCQYCDKDHCEDHRLPEDHGCKNPKLPNDIIKNRGQKEDMDWFVK